MQQHGWKRANASDNQASRHTGEGSSHFMPTPRFDASSIQYPDQGTQNIHNLDRLLREDSDIFEQMFTCTLNSRPLDLLSDQALSYMGLDRNQARQIEENRGYNSYRKMYDTRYNTNIYDYNNRCLLLYYLRYMSEIYHNIDNYGKVWYRVYTKVHGSQSNHYETNFCIDDGIILERRSFKRRAAIKDQDYNELTDKEIILHGTYPLKWNQILYAQMIDVERITGRQFDPKRLYSDRIVDPRSLEVMSLLSQNSNRVMLQEGTNEYNRLQNCSVVKGKGYFALLNCNKSLKAIELLPHDGYDHGPDHREENGFDTRPSTIEGEDRRHYWVHSAIYYFE